MNKQIEEMAKVYEEARYKANETLGSMNEGVGVWYAKRFYNAGYRKASEVAREIIQEVRNAWANSWTESEFLEMLKEIAELKKKYEVTNDDKL